jgi:hypothetical protein
MARISIDPVTRIEGHLRIDVEVDGGKVQRARAGSLPNVSVGSAPRFMPSPRCVPWKMRSGWKFQRTPSTFAT